MRGNPRSSEENLLLLPDRSPVTPIQVNNVLKTLISALNLNEKLFSFHCLRSGRATDLLKFGFTVEEIKRKGRWKSNIVYNYIKAI